MRISVIGCGYLGAVHAASMAHLGHDVVGIDVDEAKIASLAAGRAPFFEPGLPEVLQSAAATGRLRFTTDLAAAEDADVHFVAVGTPQIADGDAADMRFVDAAFASLLDHVKPGDLIVGKSTVPVGTAARLAELIAGKQPDATLAWNPEFLREGFAVKDTVSPDRLVYGVPDGEAGERAARLLDEVYASAVAAGTPVIVTDYATAELVKVSANAFLATKISFINAMAEIAEATGADVTKLADAIGHDARIGRRFLNAGVGFGGGCLPKDIRAFSARARELGRGEAVQFLDEVDKINLRRRTRVVELVREEAGGLAGVRVGVLGLAFKPHSDDIRDSPALEIAMRLAEAGAIVTATDPEALENARRRAPGLSFAATAEEAVREADVILLITEWPEFTELDPAVVGELVAHRTVIDGRNALDPASWRAAGWTYRGLGR
ncbi:MULTISPECIES: UDP-glucose/GDP-mannose dehydrogenase family protein [unclassified Leifsonia]|uniref:UDP-glucose dehydrogenase family protein n=1 Tax=unclassified Leifsonia TaxID=2663824 RepID=UPI0008A75F69|nr:MULTISPECIES: UDP-glucose/GDP-mannose dehydrogenase family protein [unclassified Leifsonia]SEI07450.1 UDPglucose 6-dehydrogenase [Leifsonia sp. CL154]SFL81000.1 UDPglucose 6-dehydrogenase [Leifsonia sp. CL147]